MENFWIALGAVAPLFLMTALGYGLKLTMKPEEALLALLNRLCFRVFLPAMIFYNIFTSDLAAAPQPRLLLFLAVGVIGAMGVFSVVVPRFMPDRGRQGTIIQGSFRSNFVLLGIPLSANIYGADQVATISMLAGFIVPLYNVLAVCTLAAHGNETVSPRQVLKTMVTNPLILASVAGIAGQAAGLTLPHCVLQTVSEVGHVATPLAVTALGARLDFAAFGKNHAALLWGAGNKLILLPLVMLPLAAVLGFRGIDLLAILVVFATPCSVSSYIMADQMGCDGELAGQMVMFTSAVFCFTMFCFIFALKTLGLL